MAWPVAWAPSAPSDLDQIAEYIARDSEFYSAATVRQIRDSAETLAALPEAGAIVPEFNDPFVREIFVKQYRIIFQLIENTAYVLGVIHGARDLRLLRLWHEDSNAMTDE